MLWKRDSQGVSLGDRKYLLSFACDHAGGSTPSPFLSLTKTKA